MKILISLIVLVMAGMAVADEPLSVEQAEAKYEAAVREAASDLLVAKISAKEAEKLAVSKSRFERLNKARAEGNPAMRKVLMAQVDQLVEKVKAVDLEIADLRKDQRALRGWEVPQPNAEEEELEIPKPGKVVNWQGIYIKGQAKTWGVRYFSNGVNSSGKRWEMRGDSWVIHTKSGELVYRPAVVYRRVDYANDLLVPAPK
jgi:hypothetical protein